MTGNKTSSLKRICHVSESRHKHQHTLVNSVNNFFFIASLLLHDQPSLLLTLVQHPAREDDYSASILHQTISAMKLQCYVSSN